MWKTIDANAVIDISQVESISMKENKIILTYLVSDIRRKTLDRFEGEFETRTVLKELRKGLVVGENPSSVFSVTALKNYDLSNVLFLDIDPKYPDRIQALVRDTRRKNLDMGTFRDKEEVREVLEELRARMTKHFQGMD